MPQTPHKDKLTAALGNPKCEASDIDILNQCVIQYDNWIAAVPSFARIYRHKTAEEPKKVSSSEVAEYD